MCIIIRQVLPTLESKGQFSLLGLGDIVIPGVFIALCLKYDVDRAILAYRKQNVKDFSLDKIPKPYFWTCVVGYAIGIIMTFNAMIIFNHAQPALLFLVPCCCLSILFRALKDGQVKDLFNYSEDSIRKLMEEAHKE